ncbi:MAG: cytochrome c nitrite reductase small subunit [Lentimicrobiaceae bacterium]|jgi:cytochrome c nitrite reductase small subunit|nr:cytochrome c nitrite reductase small subunit [Lentimicrobiaceae bacterium]MCP4910284.1 cytochrome c nitrite reductase small subunit [Bacteroidota bacterium]MBT3453851.1 cytochrome c nitrite reductase small subunit [Lentimicrobiaceae bacterium]MBT3818957.1 cytochrome c nitrite reductase small subunit [Lentimicrobiaceae bacterium]MBT4060725.1 cytochrome c nitrite reductase small subunit [Lentimicrobiaceae bacterium]
MAKFLKIILPPKQWQFIVAIAAGIFFGLTAYILYVSNAVSYMSDDPKTCINCHVMNTEYVSWTKSSHRENATCNDCHVPQNNFINKYYFKAKDGLRHATMFTLRQEPQVIVIKEEGSKVVQKNCIRCHNDLITDNKIIAKTKKFDHFRTDGRKCWECHREVPHGRVKSLSSAPNAYIPNVKKPIPDWINKLVKSKTN